MNYNIAGTEVHITDEIRTYVEKRLSALDKLLDEPDAARTDVHVRYMASEEKMYCTELLLHAPGTTEPLRAEATRGTLHEAIDVAAAELLHELKKTKKKRIHVLRRTGAKVKEYIRGWREKI
jgi:putative sigma-54 modulation protein